MIPIPAVGTVQKILANQYAGRIAWVPCAALLLSAGNGDAKDVEADRKPGSIVLMEKNRRGGKSRFDIFVVGEDGSGLTNLTRHPDEDGTPVWSPDGKRILFQSGRDGGGLFVMDADGANVKLVMRTDCVDGAPCWSPDGKRIAFASARGGNEDIYVADISGENPQRLTDALADDCYPCWSPDGKSIAFASDRTGTREIHVMTSGGDDQRLLVPNSSHPAWSPDGKHLAYVGWGAENPNRGPQPYMADADGSHAKRLADISLTSSNLSWSPDGKRVICVGGSAGFQVIDVKSGEYRVICRDSKEAKYPHWRPE